MITVPAIDQSSKRGRWEEIANVGVPFASSYGNFNPSGNFSNTDVLGLGANAMPRGMVNVPVVYLWRARQFVELRKKNWVNEMLTESIVLIQRNYEPSDLGVQITGNEVLMLGLPQLHLVIHEEYLRNPNYGLEDVIEHWMFAGSMRAGRVLDGNQGKARTVPIYPTGDLNIVNYWGPGVRGGDYLFFVAKEVEVDTETAYVTSVDGTQIIRPGIQSSKPGAHVRYVTRFCPVIGENPRTPAIKDLEYTKDCRTCYGVPFFIGLCIQNPNMTRVPRHEKEIDYKSMTCPTMNARSQALKEKIAVWVNGMH